VRSMCYEITKIDVMGVQLVQTKEGIAATPSKRGG
jgi:hypothetical protein